MGRDNWIGCNCSRAVQFQSTRPHGARPVHRAARSHPAHVSIHAPAWGATLCLRVVRAALAVSIHAPAWGATSTAYRPRAIPTRFNPRARMGRDSLQPDHPCRCCRFNPRARMGRDEVKGINTGPGYAFQSTRPHGARPSMHGSINSSNMFQSTRPHGARRQIPATIRRSVQVSIHAPAWGATTGRTQIGMLSRKFQSTRPHGARRWQLLRPRLHVRGFNPRARMGRDHCANAINASLRRFNPRARMGRDHVLAHQRAQVAAVSIHAPAWGATVEVDLVAVAAEVSIHAPAWGATRRSTLVTTPSQFQSTRPHGARRRLDGQTDSAVGVSIHAPAWGAT